MRCVWVEAYRGSERIPGGVEAMSQVQFAVDQRQQGRSSWLRVTREKTGEGGGSPKDAAKPVAQGVAQGVAKDAAKGGAKGAP